MAGRNFAQWQQYIITGGALALLIIGMMMTAEVLNIIFFGFFFALLGAPLSAWMQERGVPIPIAVAIVLGLLFIVLASFFGIFALSFGLLIEDLPTYQAQLNTNLSVITALLQQYGFSGFTEEMFLHPDLSTLVKPAVTILSNLTAVATDAFFVLVIAGFVLLELPTLPERLQKGFPAHDDIPGNVHRFIRSIIDVMIVRTKTNIVLGAAIGIFFWVLGVDLAIMWGVLAIILSYIPYIGLILACIPAIILAWLQFGIPGVLIALIGIAMINFIVETVYFPRIASRHLSLTALYILLSLLVWELILGPAGMFLSLPLAIVVAFILASQEETRWLASLITETGSPAEEPSETIFRRIRRRIG
jgi:AI-2 transport protein TqsA